MKRLVFCCLILLASISIASCTKKKEPSDSVEIQGNKQVPDITVNSLKNIPLKLSDLKGKVVLLNFWATWCPPCREEIPSMMKLNNVMIGKPFQMVAVSIDEGGVPEIESFFKTSGFSLPAYIDPSNVASKTYGITGVPESFIIDKNGVLVKKIIGPFSWDSPETISFLAGLIK